MITSASGQYSPVIRTGRPGQGIGPFTVGKHVLQLQTGVEQAGSRIEFGRGSTTQTEPGAVVRYGIGRVLELSTAFAWRTQTATFEGSEARTIGIGSSSIGFRVNLIDRKNGLPALGFQMRMKIPFVSVVRAATEPAPVYVLASNMPIGKKFGIAVNLGGDHDGVTARPEGRYVVNFSWDISDKWSTYLENYGSFGSGIEHSWDTGLGFLVNNDLQLDIYGGYGSNNGSFDHFVNAGFSYRIRTKEMPTPWIRTSTW